MTRKKSMLASDRDYFADGFFENHPMAKSMEVISALSQEEAKAYEWNFAPMAAPYFNPLGGIFLIQIFDLKLLSFEKFWLVRDGRVPLLWFFRKHPRPQGMNSTLLIDEELIDCVPEAWWPHCATYRLVCRPSESAVTHAILLGLAAEAYCSLSSLREQLEQFRSDPHFAKLKRVDLLLPVRDWPSDESDAPFHAEYFQILFNHITLPSRSLTHRAAVAMDDVKLALVKDLNDKMLLADNSVVHQLLKKGACLQGAKPLAEDERYVALSPYHGYAIANGFARLKTVSQSRRDELYIQNRYDVFNSRAFHQFPWPKWFEEFARHSQTLASDQNALPGGPDDKTEAKKKLRKRRVRV